MRTFMRVYSTMFIQLRALTYFIQLQYMYFVVYILFPGKEVCVYLYVHVCPHMLCCVCLCDCMHAFNFFKKTSLSHPLSPDEGWAIYQYIISISGYETKYRL